MTAYSDFLSTPPSAPSSPSPAEGDPVLQPFDLGADRERLLRDLEHSPEVDALTSTIDVTDMGSIVTFGAGAAEAISQASDQVLQTMSMSQLEDSSGLLTTLAGIMGRFDAAEVKQSSGFFGRLFGGAKKQVERLMAKYRSLGDEVDKVYVQLRKYEEEIRTANSQLDRLFEANVASYRELVKYIAAGEQGVREIEAYRAEREAEMRRTGDGSIRFEIQTLQQAGDLLRQRVQDLRTAEIVAMQSIPMIRTMQFNNLSLVRQINSAFIVTLPVFKQALTQAVMLRRQQVQAEALGTLRQSAGDMLKRSAAGMADAARLSGQLSPQAPADADALTASWQTIMTGIRDTRHLQEDARKQRLEDEARLEQIRADWQRKSRAGS